MSWSEIKFGEFVQVNPAVLLERGADYSFIPMELIEPENKHINSRQYRTFAGGGARFSNGDTIFARITPCLEHGKIAKVKGLSTNDGFGSTEYIVFRAIVEKSDPDYVYYLSKSEIIKGPAIKSMVGSSGRQRADKNVILGLKIKVPDIHMQRRIVNVLNVYDDLIENNLRRIELLENTVHLIYKEWFVRLKFPGHEHTKIIDGVPEGWKSKLVPDIIEINPKTTISKDGEKWYVDMSCLATDSMVISGYSKKDGLSGSKFQNGDTLFARITPCLENGKTGFVNFMGEGEAGFGSTEFIVLRGKLVPPEFVYCLSRTYDFRENAIKSMIGSSGRQRVQTACFAEYPVLLPSKGILDAFMDVASNCFSQIRNLLFQNNKLKIARDILLPKLMSGEIAV